MNTRPIAEAIAAELEAAVPDIPVFIGYPRAETIGEVAISHTDPEGRVACIYVARERSLPMTSETDRGRVPIGCQVHWNHTFEIGFFVSEFGDQQDYLQSKVDQILDHFQSVRTLNDLVFGIARPLTLNRIGAVEMWGIGGWLAHFELTVYAIETGVTPT
jgi:hypothetical protein